MNHRNSLDSGLSVTFAIDQKGLAKDPVEALLELQLAAHKISEKNRQNGKTASNGIRQQSDCLLQNIDIYRLKAFERIKNAKQERQQKIVQAEGEAESAKLIGLAIGQNYKTLLKL